MAHSPTRSNGLGSDGHVDCEWVGCRDLEDGVSPDSQPIGGYLDHALGKHETGKERLTKGVSLPR